MKSARQQAARRRRRIIVNNDGNDANGVAGPVTPEKFLEQRTTALAGTHVDSIFYCTGVVNQYTHRSELTEFRGDFERWTFARDLVEQGTDTLETMARFCRQHDLELFWSMRMNDTHDYAREINFTQWKREHPEYLMGRRGDKIPWRSAGDWDARWSALDYSHEGVRERVLSILEDVASRYDVDGVELDFFRHPLFFAPQYRGEEVTQQHCDLMTGLLAAIRHRLDEIGAQRGRPILIAARVPDALEYSRAIGLDVERWLQDDLVDILIGSGYFQLEPWENFAALGRKHNVPVYACLSASRFVAPDDGRVKLPIERWHGEALRVWEAGLDGVYLFNIFDPHDERFRQLGDARVLRALHPAYQFTTGSTWRPDYWLKEGSRFCRWPE